jgi:hypothetical protein
MKITEILVENQQVDEGPILNKIGAGIGKVAGTVAKGVGAVAGGVAGVGAALKKGYQAGKATVGAGGDEVDPAAAPAAGGGAAPAAGGAAPAAGGAPATAKYAGRCPSRVSASTIVMLRSPKTPVILSPALRGATIVTALAAVAKIPVIVFTLTNLGPAA